MESNLASRILFLLKRSNGLKASEIASKFKVTRKEINQILYGTLKKYCFQDGDYRWHYRSVGLDSNEMLEAMEKHFANKTFSAEELEAFLANL